MQGQTIYVHGWRKGVHPMHDLEALHDLHQLDDHVRTDDGNVVGGKKTSRTGLVDVIYQTGNCLGGSSAGTGALWSPPKPQLASLVGVSVTGGSAGAPRSEEGRVGEEGR